MFCRLWQIWLCYQVRFCRTGRSIKKIWLVLADMFQLQIVHYKLKKLLIRIIFNSMESFSGNEVLPFLFFWVFLSIGHIYSCLFTSREFNKHKKIFRVKDPGCCNRKDWIWCIYEWSGVAICLRNASRSNFPIASTS
jgi:hypothetical protein